MMTKEKEKATGTVVGPLKQQPSYYSVLLNDLVENT